MKKKKIKQLAACFMALCVSAGSFQAALPAAVSNAAETVTAITLTNLAAGKAVTVAKKDGSTTGVNTDRSPAMAVDGIINTNNYCDFGSITAKESAYLQVDLGGSYDISEVDLFRYWQDGRTYGTTVVVISNNGTFQDTDKTVIYNSDTANVHGFGAGTDATYSETQAGKTLALATPVKGRYVRVYMYGSSANSSNHIVELKVMGQVPANDISFAKVFENASAYLNIPAYYSDSTKVADQVTHPDVVYFSQGWNNYKYWMAYTPNVTGTSKYENASIVASNDGVNWEVPAGLTNPIDPMPSSERYHNCDADMVYNKKTNELMCYWNWADDQAGGVGAEVRVRTSTDGIHWSDYKTAVKSTKRYDMLSPAIVYDEFRDLYLMYSNNAGDVGYTNGKNNFVEVRWSKDGLNWSAPKRINNFLGKNASGLQLYPWHQDVTYIPELKQYMAISQCFSGSNPDGSVLHMTTSKDGINWEPVGTKALLSPSGTGKWDGAQIYRTCLLYDNQSGSDYGKGSLRLWYSALSANPQLWRIGYTDNTYENVMKVLNNNADYTVQPLTAGTSIDLTAALTTLTVGGTTSLTAAVAPQTASDRNIKFTSSDETVATVSPFGEVKALKGGSVTITASTSEGLSNTLSITVTEPVNATATLNGNGVKVKFVNGELELYRKTGTAEVLVSPASTSGYPVINGSSVKDFSDFNCTVENGITGKLGTGNRLTIVSKSSSTGLTRTQVIETADSVSGGLYSTVSYKAGETAVTVSKFVEAEFSLNKTTGDIWSYNGGGDCRQSYDDTVVKVTDGFSRPNKQNYASAGIPVSDVYCSNGGVAVGDASTTRRETAIPVTGAAGNVIVNISWPGNTIAAGSAVVAGDFIMNVHGGDYFNGLRGYSDAMAKQGFKTLSKEEIPESSYDLRWESWGWEFNWTMDKIINKLDQLQAMGVKQVSLDDGWYNQAFMYNNAYSSEAGTAGGEIFSLDNDGSWALLDSKLPNGAASMKELTDAIHAHGMKAVIWWRPCDGGREGSTLYKTHPEWFVKNQDGSFGKLSGMNGYNTFNGTTGYALCPSSEGAIEYYENFIETAMTDWGFDGFKSDYVWSMPKCYNPAHNHAYPEESTEKQADFYKTAYEKMISINPDAFHLLCNCGSPQDYYSLPYVTQIPTADPTSVDQTRRRVKAYKALAGDYFPVTTDHNEIWYESTVGTGAVFIEKRHWEAGTAEQQKYEKWAGIYNTCQLQKGRFIGDLYSYGLDPYETYVIEKDGINYYSFYKDGSKYPGNGNAKVELRGLDPAKIYRIEDYVNNTVLATNVSGLNLMVNTAFTNGSMLVRAVPLETPDVPVVVPTVDYVKADNADASVVYAGTWNNDSGSSFYNSTAKYTSTQGSAVEFIFTGNAIRWCGQKDTNFGTAQIYIDDNLMGTVNCNGPAATQSVLYENTNLTTGIHKIRIVNATKVIDVDYFEYATIKKETVVAVTGVSLNVIEKTMTAAGDAFQLAATVAPADAANKNVTWTSTNQAVATVSTAGLVTAVADGIAKIRVTTADGSRTAECIVTVVTEKLTPTESFVQRFYSIVLGRDAAAEEISYYTESLISGERSGADVGRGFVCSPEFVDKALSNADYVEVLYNIFMDRVSDEGGKAYWLDFLNNGVSREFVFKGFVESAEFTEICASYGINRGNVELTRYTDKYTDLTRFINRLYTEVLGRAGEEAGLEYYAKEIAIGNVTPVQAAQNFIFSPEFKNKKFGNEDYVKVLYKTFMGREYDAAGLDYHLDRMSNGISREEILLGFANSPEFKNIISGFGLK